MSGALRLLLFWPPVRPAYAEPPPVCVPFPALTAVSVHDIRWHSFQQSAYSAIFSPLLTDTGSVIVSLDRTASGYAAFPCYILLQRFVNFAKHGQGVFVLH